MLWLWCWKYLECFLNDRTEYPKIVRDQNSEKTLELETKYLEEIK